MTPRNLVLIIGLLSLAGCSTFRSTTPKAEPGTPLRECQDAAEQDHTGESESEGVERRRVAELEELECRVNRCCEQGDGGYPPPRNEGRDKPISHYSPES